MLDTYTFPNNHGFQKTKDQILQQYTTPLFLCPILQPSIPFSEMLNLRF